MGHYDDVIDDLKEPTRSLGWAIPDTWDAFTQLHYAAVADGALPAGDRHVGWGWRRHVE